MSIWSRLTTVMATGAALAAAASVNIGAARQSATAQVDPIPALLAEVHALRLAMERSATVNPRVQLTLTRLGIQEQRTTQLGAQLDQVRRQLAEIALGAARMARELEELERTTASATREETRRGAEYERTMLKQRMVNDAALEQQLRVRENDLAQMLATEQARWSDLNARLDELERLLGPVR